MIRRAWNDFWEWYERNYRLNITIAAILFSLQIIHLIWLFTDVIWTKLFGQPLVHLDGLFRSLLILVDYTEIPALISVSFVYINDLRREFAWKPFLFLLFLNSQWLHLFWITDEFVIGELGGEAVALPGWLAWVAILIDYLEVPVIVETLRKMFRALREGRMGEFARTDLREH